MGVAKNTALLFFSGDNPAATMSHTHLATASVPWLCKEIRCISMHWQCTYVCTYHAEYSFFSSSSFFSLQGCWSVFLNSTDIP